MEVLKAEFSVSKMCKWLGISRAAHYSWLRGRSRREARAVGQRHLLDKIRQAHQASRGTYGSRRILLDLKDGGENVGRHQVATLMREAGLSGVPRKRWKATTDSKHGEEISPNLLDRNFTVEAPNTVWVGDITYIRTTTGWQYLATVIDLYSRMIVGWALAGHMRSELVEDALKMACGRREVKPGLIFHSDRGSQYVSKEFRKLLAKHGMLQSMSRKGNCWDNAVAESFFSTIKRDKLNEEVWRSTVRLRLVVFEYIEGFYNRTRRHSTLGGISPLAFEKSGCVQTAAKAA
jgi:transposase InsO family protein